jgi:hypothetical protein
VALMVPRKAGLLCCISGLRQLAAFASGLLTLCLGFTLGTPPTCRLPTPIKNNPSYAPGPSLLRLKPGPEGMGAMAWGDESMWEAISSGG